MKNKIGILGTGAYGIALAKMFHENECDILMWTKFAEEKKVLETTKCNEKVLPGILIDDDIKITNSLEEICKHSDILVICIPAAFVIETIESIKELVKDETIFCVATKGIDEESGMFMSDILEQYFDKERIVVVSGPSFASDVVSNQPTGLSIASTNDEAMEYVSSNLANKYLKLIPTNDVLGVLICGAIKNVMAIASGILEGFNANPSCNAMFLTEAMHDIKDLIRELGGSDRTILSYAGFGDILLTCTSSKSRNFTFGYYLVTKTKEEIDEYRNNTTIEGLYTLNSIKNLIKKKNIDMPIIAVIDQIVNDGCNPKTLLDYLMNKKITLKK